MALLRSVSSAAPGAVLFLAVAQVLRIVVAAMPQFRGEAVKVAPTELRTRSPMIVVMTRMCSPSQ